MTNLNAPLKRPLLSSDQQFRQNARAKNRVCRLQRPWKMNY